MLNVTTQSTLFLRANQIFLSRTWIDKLVMFLSLGKSSFSQTDVINYIWEEPFSNLNQVQCFLSLKKNHRCNANTLPSHMNSPASCYRPDSRMDWIQLKAKLGRLKVASFPFQKCNSVTGALCRTQGLTLLCSGEWRKLSGTWYRDTTGHLKQKERRNSKMWKH